MMLSMRKTIHLVCILGMLLLSLPTLHAQDFLQKAKNYLDAGGCEKAQRAYEAFKVEYPAGNAEVERRIAECGKESQRIIPKGYVDLGLPSGTLWKDKDEEGGYYKYDEAVNKFGSKLPNQNQCEELVFKCKWSWIGDAYKVVGPNGNYIVLPAKDFLYHCDGSVESADSLVWYWTSTAGDSEFAWGMWYGLGDCPAFSGMSGICSWGDVNTWSRCEGLSIRLVYNK